MNIGPQQRIAIMGTGALGRRIPKVLLRDKDMAEFSSNISEITYISRTGSTAGLEANTDESSVVYNSIKYEDDAGLLDAVVVTASIKIKVVDGEVDLRPLMIDENTRDVLERNVIPFFKRHYEKHKQMPEIIVATNPVYAVTTYLYHRLREEKIPYSPQHLVGVGSRTDSRRLRYITADIMGVPLSKVTNAHVIGDHGKSMVPVITKMQVEGKFLWDFFKDSTFKKGGGWATKVMNQPVPPAEAFTTAQFVKGAGRAAGRHFTEWEDLARFIAEKTRCEGTNILKDLGQVVDDPADDLAGTLVDMLSDGEYTRTRNKKITTVGTWLPREQVYAGMPALINGDGVRLVGPEFALKLGGYEKGRLTHSVQCIRQQTLEMYMSVAREAPELLQRRFHQYSAEKAIAPAPSRFG